MQEMRDSERRIGALEREVGARDARLEEANQAKASIGIELAQSQKKIQILEAELEALTQEVSGLRTTSAGASGEMASLASRCRDAEEEARRQAADAESQAHLVKRMKQELEASREQLTQVAGKLREQLEAKSDELTSTRAVAAKAEVRALSLSCCTSYLYRLRCCMISRCVVMWWRDWFCGFVVSDSVELRDDVSTL